MRRQLALMAAATTAMVVIAFLVPLGLAVQTIAANEALNDAEVQARSLAPTIATVSDTVALEQLVRSANATSTGPLSVFMPDGRVLGATATRDADVALAQSGRSFTSSNVDGSRVFVPVVITGSGIAVVEVVVPESRLHRGVGTAWAILGATGIGLVVLAVIVADRIARGMLLPTRALAEAAQDVARGDLQTKVTPGGPPEIADVGRAFNLLVSRIGDLLAAEREAAADLSHRLRTPLTALRLDVERIRTGSESERLAADVDAMENAVTQVIVQMRRRSRDGGKPVTDLVATARARIGFWASLAQEQGRRCEIAMNTGPKLVGLEREEVETIVDVLVGNVFAHTPHQTPFKVLLEEPRRNFVGLVVEDQGPGFPSELVARGQSGAESTGLGLDIVRRTAEAAGGSVKVSSRPGRGARVEVILGTVKSQAPTSAIE